MKKNRQKHWLLVVTLAWLLPLGTLVGGSNAAAAKKTPMKMAEGLATLRKEVDGLASELEEKKEEMKGRIRSYATQKAEVEAEIQRAKMRLAQLQESHHKRVEKISEEDDQIRILTPAVLEAIGLLKNKISTGLPFKREERIAELDRLIRQIDEKLLHPVNAFARVWDQAEDEFRLGRESGVYKQVITLDGTEVLADVIRIGMVMMYAKTKDGQLGKTVFRDGKWHFEKLRSPAQHKQVLYLFDSFKKQIRTGLFTVPSALPKRILK